MKRVLSELRPYAGLLLRRRWAALLGALLLLATVSAAIGLLALSGWFITATGITALAWAAGQRAALEVFLPGAGIRFFALTRALARYGERLQQHDVTFDLLRGLRVAVFTRLTTRPTAIIDHLQRAGLMQRLIADVDALDNLLLRVINPALVAAAMLALLGLALALLVSPLMLWPVALLALIVTGLCQRGLSVGMLPGRRLRARQERLFTRSLRALDGLAELRSVGRLDAYRDASERLDVRLRIDGAARDRRLAALEAATGVAVQLAAVAALMLALHALGSDGMAPALAVLAALAVLGTMELLPGLPQAFHRLGETQTAAARLNALLRDAPAPPEPRPLPEVQRPATSTAIAVALRAVSLQHTTRRSPALCDVDLQLGIGERIAIVGASGCGKSSLLDVIAGLYPPTRGAVIVFGRHQQDVPATQWLKTMAMLTQRNELFADSIAVNLRLAAPDASDSALWAALHVAALSDTVRRLPEGLDTRIGEQGARLSGGQARRLALARVVLRDAPLVLLDEPCTGLDAATADIVRGRLDVWLKGRSAVLVAHATEVLPQHDRVLTLHDGCLNARHAHD